MGCDFFYDGNLSDVSLQEKVISFVKDFFTTIDLHIIPDARRSYATEINLPSIGREYTPHIETHDEYPFNFYGMIPYCKDEGISDQCQFIFNRNDNGRLVKLRRLPDSYGIKPHYYYREKPEPRRTNEEFRSQGKDGKILGRVVIPPLKEFPKPLLAEKVPFPYQVVVDDGGYARLGGGLAFALLLTICKLRWWPDLKMCDDYEYCEIVDALLRKYDLHQQLLDESLDFHASHKLFITEYDRDFPPAPSQDSGEDRMKANAQWYLDFWEKVKPYLRERKAPESEE